MGRFKNVHTMAFAGLVLGVCNFLLGIVPVFWIYLLVMGITGLAVPVFNTPSTVLLQEKIEETTWGAYSAFSG